MGGHERSVEVSMMFGACFRVQYSAFRLRHTDRDVY